MSTYNVNNRDIKLTIDFTDDAFFDMDTTVLLGMIVNELVTNAFKHAFADHDAGKISVVLSKGSLNNDYILQVSDDGDGIGKNVNVNKCNSLGMQIVMSLVDQLDGTLNVKNDNGTTFTLLFAVNNGMHH